MGVLGGPLFCDHTTFQLFSSCLLWLSFHLSELLGALVFSWFLILAVFMGPWNIAFMEN